LGIAIERHDANQSVAIGTPKSQTAARGASACEVKICDDRFAQRGSGAARARSDRSELAAPADSGCALVYRLVLGFPPSSLYVATADRAIGFEMPPDIPASDLKK
jgi:hypothetical protein